MEELNVIIGAVRFITLITVALTDMSDVNLYLNYYIICTQMPVHVLCKVVAKLFYQLKISFNFVTQTLYESYGSIQFLTDKFLPIINMRLL